jgi:hypothetical protein
MKKSQVMALVIALALLGFSCARKDSSEASNSGSKDDSAASDNSSKSAQVKEDTASDFVSESSNSSSKVNSAASDQNTASADTNNSGSKSATVKEATDSDFVYEWTDDRQGVRIKKYIGSKTDVLVIPATIEGLPVREIQGVGEADSTEIVLPKSVTRIETSLPNRLTKINLPDGLKEISNSLFTYNGFRTVNLPDSLIKLPDSLEKIGVRAFEGCFNLTTIKLPDGIQRIDYQAFARCYNLTTINLPANLKEIAWGAFEDCSELKNLIIPDSLNSVKFMGDGAGTSVYPSNDAFTGCHKLPLATRARIEELGYKGSF